MEAEKCIWLFAINCMKANLDKFLAILLNCEGEGSLCLNVNGYSIEPSEEVTLLGVRLDSRLVSNHHTNELCNKTGRQVNDLKQLCHHISPDVKMAISELLSSSIYSTAQQYGTIAQYQTLKN